jgi:phage gpG-like protein
MGTFEGLVGVLIHAPEGFRSGAADGLEKAAQIVEDEAKRVIGTYDYGWPSLQPETIKRKTTGDSPLLESGEMRDSITHKVDQATMQAWVGSDNDKALFHELGTVHIPARSFLAGAAMHKEEECHALIGKTVVNTMFSPLYHEGTLPTRWVSPLV